MNSRKINGMTTPIWLRHPLLGGLVLGKVFLSVVLMVSLGCVPHVNAQKHEYFVADGKKVNTDGFNKQVDQMLREVGVPGLSLAIIEDNKVVFSNYYGYKQVSTKERVNKSTVFEAASLTKVFLVYVVHQLAAAGQLDLDRPMYKYLAYEPLAHDGRYKLITPRMILGHTSGIENWTEYNNPNVLEILNNPGEKFVYSGEGFQYLAKVVEVILNEPYDKYIASRIIEPFKMKHTYLKYKKNVNLLHRGGPRNYATGHDLLNGEYGKWKNEVAVPASSAHGTAREYAEFITGVFAQGPLHKERIKNILIPVVPLGKSSEKHYMGTGFSMRFTDKDTIISFDGSNGGFRSELFYSVTNRRGLVYFSNSDQGTKIARKLNEISANLDINSFFEAPLVQQYPNNAIYLHRIYREKGVNAMFEEIESMAEAHQLTPNDLNQLSDNYTNYSTYLSKQLLEKNIRLFPESSLAYCLLAYHFIRGNDYTNAYHNFQKAKYLNFDLWDIETDFEKCKAGFEYRQKICSMPLVVDGNGPATIQAEDYCQMAQVLTEATADVGGGLNVGHIGTGDWMDYTVEVANEGYYSVAFRVASVGGGELQLLSDAKVVAAVDIPSTNGWQAWDTVSANVYLSEGKQTLRIFTPLNGNFNINWFRLGFVKN